MNMNKIKIFLGLFALLLLSTNLNFAQKSQVFEDEDFMYKKGLEFFNKAKYVIAQDYFKNVIQSSNDKYSDVRVDAEFYYAICALELFHENSEYLISQFIISHPESPRSREAYFQMGRFYYRDKNYDKAITWFEKIDKYDLDKQDLEEYYFKLAYCYFTKGNIEKSENLFYELVDGTTNYAAPAIYYYAHIAYEKGNFETALKWFEKINDHESFKLLVPYYIAQINYNNKKYEKAIEYGTQLAQSENVKREAEINRIIGESYFKLEKYEEALEYLEKFKDKAETYARNDIYQLAYVYYKTNNFEKAAKTFSLVTNVEDTLTQHAYYLIADSYLKLDDKNSARLSFENAGRYSFDQTIKEDAMFQFAKLTYDLSFSPFNETINAFQSYIDENPNSKRVDQAYDYLMKVFLSAKNYEGAINAIENIKQKTVAILKAYQRVTYFRGLELLNNLNYIESLEAFTKSLENSNYDRELKALALYWRGEAYYRLKDYNNAIKDYEELLVTPGAFSLKEYDLATYNLAYSQFKLKDYQAAALSFRKFTDNYELKTDKRYGDALVRTGDCYFVSKDYRRAVEFYAKVDTSNSYDKDYALFQEGFAQGLLKNNLRKIEILNQLLEDSTSSYIDDALFELANSYIAIDSNELALKSYYQLLEYYPNSSYISKALVQTALLEYNESLLEKSLHHYKTVINNYPGSDEAQEALIGIKNVYVEMNDVDAYFAYVQSLGKIADISENEQDQLVYQAAENIYMTGDCDKTIDAFKNYIKRFPNGKSTLNANYYIAECYYNQNIFDSSLVLFESILAESKNAFTEQSLILAAEIQLANKDYKEAFNKYLILEEIAEVKSNLVSARMGQLLAADSLQNLHAVITTAKKVLKTDKIGDEFKREARFKMANALYDLESTDSALIQFRILSQDVKNEIGAESKYNVIKILYDQGKTLLSENEVFAFVDANTSHQFWLAKSFLVLARIYLSKEDAFQAKATLNSILDNYENKDDGVYAEAEELLKEIKASENEIFEEAGNEVEIQFDTNVENDTELFEEEENNNSEEIENE